MKPNRISYETQENILTQLYLLLNNEESYTNRLKAQGYFSFRAWSEFDKDCFTPDELPMLDEFIGEREKRFFTSPDGFLGKEKSKYLATLASSVDPSSDRFPRGNPEAYTRINEIRATRDLRFRQYRLAEANFKLGKSHINEQQHFSGVYRDTLLDKFGEFGFTFDESRSIRDFPVISKPLCDGWDICWSDETDRNLMWHPAEKSDDVGKWSHIDLKFYARASRNKGYVRTPFVACPLFFKKLDYMLIRLSRLVNGFGWAYARFNGIEELGLVMGAYATLYSELSEKLESSLRELLEHNI